MGTPQSQERPEENLDRERGVGALAGSLFLSTSTRVLGCGGFRFPFGRSCLEVLCAADGAAQPGAGDLVPVLIKVKWAGVDATMVEASAATRSVLRRDTIESYEELLTGLGKGIGHHEVYVQKVRATG
jgi:hypothetical protein